MSSMGWNPAYQPPSVLSTNTTIGQRGGPQDRETRRYQSIGHPAKGIPWVAIAASRRSSVEGTAVSLPAADETR